MPGAWVFVSEHVDPSHVGIACGILTAGLTGGILLGSLVAATAKRGDDARPVGNLRMADSFSTWRRLRSAVDVPSPFVSRDTGLFRIESAPSNCLRDAVKDGCARLSRRDCPKWITNLDAVCGHYGGYSDDACFAGEDVRCGGGGCACAPTAWQPLPFPAGCVLAGWLTDRFGPGTVLTVGCPLLGVATYLMYTAATSDPWLIMFLYTLAGLTVGIVAVVPYVMIAMFPPEIRFSGISFSYNIAYAIFGGLTPVVVAWLLRFDRLAPAHYVGALCLLGLGIGVFIIAQGSTLQRRERPISQTDKKISHRGS